MATMDQAIKRLFQVHAAKILPYFLPGLTAVRPLPTDVAMERQLILDTLYRVRYYGQRCLINVEVQIQATKELLARFRIYTERAHATYQLPVIPLLLLLTPKGKQLLPAPPLVEKVGNRHSLDLLTWNYFPLRLYEMSAYDIIQKGVTALLPLVPLMQGADRETDRAAMEMIKMHVSHNEQPIAATLLAIFTARQYNARFAQALVREVFMSSSLLEQSPLYREWIKKAAQEGRQEGRREVMAEMWRDRFGAITDEVITRLAEGDAATLQVLRRLLMQPDCSLPAARALLGLEQQPRDEP